MLTLPSKCLVSLLPRWGLFLFLMNSFYCHCKLLLSGLPACFRSASTGYARYFGITWTGWTFVIMCVCALCWVSITRSIYVLPSWGISRRTWCVLHRAETSSPSSKWDPLCYICVNMMKDTRIDLFAGGAYQRISSGWTLGIHVRFREQISVNYSERYAGAEEAMMLNPIDDGVSHSLENYLHLSNPSILKDYVFPSSLHWLLVCIMDSFMMTVICEDGMDTMSWDV